MAWTDARRTLRPDPELLDPAANCGPRALSPHAGLQQGAHADDRAVLGLSASPYRPDVEEPSP
jgi:hypothetical protein